MMSLYKIWFDIADGVEALTKNKNLAIKTRTNER